MRELRKMMLLEFVLLLLPLLLCLHFRLAVSEIFFEEQFEDGWKSRWVLSDWKRAEGKAGTFKYIAGKWSGDPDDKGTQNNIEEQKDEDLELPLFDLSTIETATNKFSINNKLGEGGFESVYEGTLLDGKEIAVKRLSRSSGQGMKEFKNEVILIAKLQHRNLVKLLHKVFAELKDLANEITLAELVSPTLIVIGKVVALSTIVATYFERSGCSCRSHIDKIE